MADALHQVVLDLIEVIQVMARASSDLGAMVIRDSVDKRLGEIAARTAELEAK